jgi:ABC-type Fe3+ transport system permease subunit
MSLSSLEIVALLWGVVVVLYFVFFLYRSIIGLHEEDNLYLSAGEARMEAEQRQVMKQITRLDAYSHKIGIVALAMTVILAVMWGYSVARNLF